ncbi:hypothetical protein CTEN210_14321 [Chaetoceros tenuissimus]|uniref:Uncharacterized protein n=1 Tax=Chaetoceros tenuissimus TaxID=426638 RepID=A0AAD3HBV1_9STRA|nr:hypothetical protein CTEN210_14321 [Chaetoceros tenuissimus]
MASAEDDLFASLGNSLMRDLLSDISGQDGSSNENDMFSQLANLEKELEAGSSNNAANNTSASGPPGLASSSTAPSAAAMVVGASSLSQPPPTLSSPLPTSKGQDAFSASLQQFSALNVQDFLQADSARKEQLQKTAQVSNDLVKDLFEDDTEEYDVKQDIVLEQGGSQMAQLFQKPMQGQQQQQPPPQAMVKPTPQPQGMPIRNVPPHGMPPQGMPPPPMMQMPGAQGMPPPPHMMGSPPPPHMMPPHMQHMMMMQMRQQQIMMQQQMMQQGQMQGHAPPTANRNMMSPQSQNAPTPAPTPNDKLFKKMDFPALGADASTIAQERKEEEMQLKQEQKARRENLKKAKELEQQRRNRPAVRMTFSNANPAAAPIPANAIHATSMTSRDLCYVLHSMLRPVLTHASVLDAYNADYYRWSYDDRKSRNLLFLGGNMPTGNQNLPNPVWKETKVKAQKMEEDFRETVEKRADEWSKEKNALGKVVKVNVKRPRALLATTALSSNADKTIDESDHSAETEEDRQRALLWAGRVAIDKGYQAYLNLVELRRLLQSRPGDTFSGDDSDVANRREELLKDVEDNVSKLQAAFGLKKEEGDQGVEFDCKILARTLTLPKGRMLLSRVIDEGILPHPSACKVLPNAIKVVFDTASTGDLSAAQPAGEDRLLRSLAGLVKTTQPSVDPANLLLCLDSTINAETIIDGEKRSMKGILTSKRTLMELLYAIFSRGSEVCVGAYEGEWKEKESKFLAVLSST